MGPKSLLKSSSFSPPPPFWPSSPISQSSKTCKCLRPPVCSQSDGKHNQRTMIPSMVQYHFTSKRFLSSDGYQLISPLLARSGRFRACCITSGLSIVRTANSNQALDDKVDILKQKMAVLEINCDDSCVPGHFGHIYCPKCKGGKSMERSLSVHIMQEADFAMWRCYHTSCGWAGQAFSDGRLTSQGYHKIFKAVSTGQLTAESIVLEPLGEKLIAYFANRMISEETLHRNAVMQVAGDKDIIAFTYRHKGVLVGCKYRTTDKRYWQDKGTEKWLYGLDDMEGASELIIVEGELDKLSMEEAGFRNCVSVPNGAPQVVSKELPQVENDRAFQYIWNCRENLDKSKEATSAATPDFGVTEVSRIVVATDGDSCGQALGEELVRRLGKERCWVVRWPKKDETSSCKDANEVLKQLGGKALKQVIESAELYNAHSSFSYHLSKKSLIPKHTSALDNKSRREDEDLGVDKN